VLIVACLLATSYALLLPVVPVIVERRGTSGEAGAATAVLFAGTVLAELTAPLLISRISSRLLAAAAMLLAGPLSLLYVIPHLDVALLLLCTFARGAGFGLAVVICTALIFNLAAQGKSGVAIGSFGLVTTAPLVIVPSIGLLLLGAGHLESAVVASALAATLGAIAALGLPKTTGFERRFHRPELPLARPAVIFTLVCLTVVHLSYGGLISFIPVYLPAQGLGSSATFLFVAGAARTLSRYLAGVVVDRVSAGAIVLAGTVFIEVGLLLVPSRSAAPLLIAAALIYGLGHGAVQTATYVRLVRHSDPSQVTIISATWNMAIDLGISAGAAIFGLVAGSYGIAAVFWVLPIVLASSIPLALIGSHREEAT
jgi:predicted MFS family arabinose efflux permease